MALKSVKAYGTDAPEADLKQLNINRRAITKDDIEIDI